MENIAMLMEKKDEFMNWFKKHKDMVAVISSIGAAVFVMMNSINNSEQRLTSMIHDLDKKLSSKINETHRELSHEISMVNNEIVKIQTVMIIKGIVPTDIFTAKHEE